MKFIEAMELLHGKKIMRTWRHHVEEDADHYVSIQREIVAHPEHARLIEMNAIQTAHYLVSSHG
jgi:hypothetical protein